MGVHDGHRERLRDRFTDYGLDNFNDLNVLELLLFYAIPRRDTNTLAHALLDHFGSLDAVFDASVHELQAVPGIGPNAAALIHLVPQIARRCAMSRTRDLTSFPNSSAAAAYLVPRLGMEKAEKALMLCLNPQKQLICCTELANGVVDSVNLNIRLVVESALKTRASSVILAHNHPSGNPSPSRDDELLTRRVREALQLVEITLDDHLIIAGQNYFSFTDSGLLLYPGTSRLFERE